MSFSSPQPPSPQPPSPQPPSQALPPSPVPSRAPSLAAPSPGRTQQQVGAQPGPAQPQVRTQLGPAQQQVGAQLVVLSGPSGVGKTTVVRELRRQYPQVWVSVSVTTRHPRPGELHGVHYRFVSDEEFDRLVTSAQLLEWAYFAGHRYGTPRQPVLDRLAAGVPVLLEIEISGARQVRASMPQARLVFLTPPSWAELERRLIGRGTETPEVVARRLALAREEMAAQPEFDVSIVNSSVEQVCERLLPLLGISPSLDRKAT